ncbi:aryl-sulfate sulfotransferase [Bizionia sp. KMM 8389]
MKNNIITIFICFLSLLNCSNDDHVSSYTNTPETPTVLEPSVLVYENGIFDGYTLLSPLGSPHTYLINNEGFVVNKWSSEMRALVSYLSPEGNLIRAITQPDNNFSSGATGAIEILDFEGNQLWFWEYNTPEHVLHHDIELLPNNNLLVTVWENKSATNAINQGRDPNLLNENAVWHCKILEIEILENNQAQIVWEWSVWDHLIQDFDNTKANYGVVSEHPELLDINFSNGSANFNHINSIDYIEEFDQIVLSSRVFNEFWIIDHSTTTEEAASHSGGSYNKGGDLLYRWGNPQTYNSGTDSQQRLYGQHDVTWIGNSNNADGNFLLFNNDRFLNKSSIDEVLIPQNTDGSYNLEPHIANLPESYAWSFNDPLIYSPRLSGANRLNNGNTLITMGGTGTIFEVNASGSIIWQYQVPIDGNSGLFKVKKYNKNYSGFQGRTLTPLTVPVE